MATRKKNNAQNPQDANRGAELQNQAEPQVALSEFSKWVSFAGIAMKTDSLFGAKKEALDAEPEVARAWEVLSRPSIMAARYIGIGTKSVRNYASSKFTSDYNSSPNALLNAALSGFTEGQAVEIAQALDILAKKLIMQASSREIKEAAKQASKLWVAPASEQSLGYPTLGIGLAESYTMVDGKRQKTLSGQKIYRMSLGGGGYDMDGRMGFSGDDRRVLDMPAEDQRATWATEAQQGPLAQEQENAVKWGAHGELSPLAGFFAVPNVNGQSIITGESELPTVKVLSLSLAEIKSEASKAGREAGLLAPELSASLSGAENVSRSYSVKNSDWVEGKKKSAAELAHSSWRVAMSCALSPADAKGFSSERLQRIDLVPGFKEFFKLPSFQMNYHYELSMVSESLEKIAKKEMEVSDHDMRQESGQAKYSAFSKTFASQVLGEASVWSGRPQKSKVDFDSVIRECLEGAEVIHLVNKRGGYRDSLNPADKSAAKIAAEKTFDRLSKAAKSTPPGIGVAQWALGLVKNFDDVKHKFNELSESDRKKAQGRQLEPNSPAFLAKEKLMDSLSGFCDAALLFKSSFEKLSLEEAQKTELAWLASKGLDKAWVQALQSGVVSPRSLGWALANPAGESMSSSDPVERLAARCARSFGLNPGQNGEELKSAFYAELMEMGASPEGLKILEASHSLQEQLAALAALSTGGDKKIARASRSVMSFFAAALSVGDKVGMPPEELALFCSSYTNRWLEKNNWEQNNSPFNMFNCAVPGAEGRFDGLSPELAAIVVATQSQARLYAELSRSKSEGYHEMVESLAKDWRQTMDGAQQLGSSFEHAIELSEARAEEIRHGFPSGAVIDWRKRPFANKAAWEIFEMPSPRFTAAVKNAKEQCGDIGAWCADRARQLGILDAVDGNDLVGKTRNVIKEKLSLSDAAWKLAIKQPEALALISQTLNLHVGKQHYATAKVSKEAMLSATMENMLPRRGTQADAERASIERGYNETTGMALTTAASRNIDPKLASETLRLFADGGPGHKRYALLSSSINPMLAQSHEEAEFFIQECEAKKERQPRVFAEACKRLDKLKQDSAKALDFYAKNQDAIKNDLLPDTRFDPKEKLAAELDDLGDWIEGSEHGLWSQQPLELTIGQFSRQSKAWHDEQAAMAADKADRARVRQAVAEAVAEADASKNPFAVNAGSRWAKIVGKHARDGWEAVELLSAGDLTEEGAAMRHCVSSYSSVCRQGDSRVYSIRLNGERKCTLEIRPSEGLSKLNENKTFSIVQNKGVANQAVNNKATLDFCQEVLGQVQAAWPKIVKKIEAARADNKEAKKVAQEAKEKALQELALEKESAQPKAKAKQGHPSTP